MVISFFGRSFYESCVRSCYMLGKIPINTGNFTKKKIHSLGFSTILFRVELDYQDSLREQSPGSILQNRSSQNFTKFTGKHLCRSCNFIKKETLAHIFSCEFCEISKNTSFYRTPSVAASVFKSFRKASFSKQPFAMIYKAGIPKYLGTITGGAL